MRQCQTIDDRSKSSDGNNNVRQSVRQDVTDGNIAEITGDIKSQSITVSPSDKEKFLGLISNYELIMNMLDNYKNNEDKFNRANGLVVELPVEKKKDFRITLRLNDVVYEEFKEFADKNKQFTVKELVSQALKEFIQKYK